MYLKLDKRFLQETNIELFISLLVKILGRFYVRLKKILKIEMC